MIVSTQRPTVKLSHVVTPLINKQYILCMYMIQLVAINLEDERYLQKDMTFQETSSDFRCVKADSPRDLKYPVCQDQLVSNSFHKNFILSLHLTAEKSK